MCVHVALRWTSMPSHPSCPGSNIDPDQDKSVTEDERMNIHVEYLSPFFLLFLTERRARVRTEEPALGAASLALPKTSVVHQPESQHPFSSNHSHWPQISPTSTRIPSSHLGQSFSSSDLLQLYQRLPAGRQDQPQQLPRQPPAAPLQVRQQKLKERGGKKTWTKRGKGHDFVHHLPVSLSYTLVFVPSFWNI